MLGSPPLCRWEGAAPGVARSREGLAFIQHLLGTRGFPHLTLTTGQHPYLSFTEEKLRLRCLNHQPRVTHTLGSVEAWVQGPHCLFFQGHVEQAKSPSLEAEREVGCKSVSDSQMWACM